MELDDAFNFPSSPIDFGENHDHLSLDILSYGIDSAAVEQLAPLDQDVFSPVPTSALKSKLSSLPRRRAPKRRKLPGPAGLLPQGNEGNVLTKSHSYPTRIKRTLAAPKDGSSSLLLSQTTEGQSEESELLSLLREDCGSVIWPSIEKYSISNVLQLILKGHLPRGKVPVMCGFLDDVELSPTDAKAVLRDRSGSIGCTIHRSVIKEYKNQMAGCVLLLLKQVSLFSPTGKNFYLNITLSNLVRVYTPERIFPLLTSSRSVNPRLNNPPLLPSDLDSLEADCMKPLSPPSPKRISPLRTQNEGSSLLHRSQTRTPCKLPVHPHKSNFVRSAPVRRVSDDTLDTSSDQSPYRLGATPRGSQTFPTTKRSGPVLPSVLRPSLGSLVRSSLCTPNQHPVSPIDHLSITSVQTPTELEIGAKSENQPPSNLDSLLNDDMDDLLSNLADESMCSLGL